MRRPFLAGLATGAVVTAVVAFAMTRQLLWLERTAQVSNVEAPIGGIIPDLYEATADGDCELLAAKVRILKNRWDAFQKGDDRPDGFQREIHTMKVPAEDGQAASR